MPHSRYRLARVLARRALLAGLVASLAACGEPPPTATGGQRLDASFAERFSDGPAPARELTFSPDGRLLATTNVSGTVRLRRVSDWKIALSLEHPGGATAIAFAPDGSWFVTAGYDGKARIWDVVNGQPLRRLDGATGTLWTIAVSPDGGRIAAGGEDRLIHLWNAADGRQLGRLAGHGRNIWEVRFSPDGSRLASGSFDRSLRLWDAKDGRALRNVADHAQAVVGLAWSRDGHWLVTGGDDSTLRLRRGADGVTTRVIANGNHAYKLAFSPDGKWIASAGRAHGGFGTFWHQLSGGGGKAWPLKLWRTGDGALVAALPSDEDLASVAFSPDGRLLAAAADDGTISVWRLATAHGDIIAH